MYLYFISILSINTYVYTDIVWYIIVIQNGLSNLFRSMSLHPSVCPQTGAAGEDTRGVGDGHETSGPYEERLDTPRQETSWALWSRYVYIAMYEDVLLVFREYNA